ncbi:hypothetical protein H8K52_19860 [Undibacterium seohonense]|uniref:Uncharacterized protein n=2 Tax=Undibacterium seohonense TaxID=1344950 RepID=A0ABR6X9L6_9BURK|nr:hypothetical protein [Undibacterium seohonense]
MNKKIIDWDDYDGTNGSSLASYHNDLLTFELWGGAAVRNERPVMPILASLHQ